MAALKGLKELDVGEVSKNKELTAVDKVPEVVEVLLQAHLSHLAYFDRKKESQWKQTYHIARLCYPFDLNETLDHYWANERQHVE